MGVSFGGYIVLMLKTMPQTLGDIIDKRDGWLTIYSGVILLPDIHGIIMIHKLAIP